MSHQRETPTETMVPVLVADDDSTSRKYLQRSLEAWGHGVTAVADGQEALETLRSPQGPELAILDWMMPGLDGLELCRALRDDAESRHLYLIILTARDSVGAVAQALRAGADDFVAKPFVPEELQARIQVGVRVLELQSSLARQVRELKSAMRAVNHLQGLLPICCYCSKVRDDQHYWERVESYVSKHSDVVFSHCICPECYEDLLRPQLSELGLDLPDIE